MRLLGSAVRDDDGDQHDPREPAGASVRVRVLHESGNSVDEGVAELGDDAGADGEGAAGEADQDAQRVVQAVGGGADGGGRGDGGL